MPSRHADTETFPLDFGRLVPRRTPNRFLVLPPGFAAEAAPDHVSPVFAADPQHVIEAWCGLVEATPRVRCLHADPALRQYAHVARTAVFRFPDHVTAQSFALGAQGSALAIYSRARYGRSDLGVNRRRVLRWLDHLRERIDTT